MDALAVVLATEDLLELYALRKKVFLPKFVKIEDDYLNNLEKYFPHVNGTPVTLAATILEQSFAYTPELTLSELNQQCRDLDLPLPGTWDQCVKSTQDVVDFNIGCHGDSRLFGDIGQESYWNARRRLMLFLGLCDDQDQMAIEDTWFDRLYRHPGLRARQLVNLYNKLNDSSKYELEDWEEDDWCFSIDSKLNPGE
jgi:hypothetical protein